MSSMTRRSIAKLMLAGSTHWLCEPAQIANASSLVPVIRGVEIGACTYSFRPIGVNNLTTYPTRLLNLDGILEAFSILGLRKCELWTFQVEPQGIGEVAKLDWRFSIADDYFRQVRSRFDRAGVAITAYNPPFFKGLTDPEIERSFQITQALGIKNINASGNVSMVPRVDHFAQKYGITVGFHNHDHSWDPDEFSNGESYERALEGASEYIGINLDVGHFVAAGGDPVVFINKYHERITALHIKDRKKNHGPNTPFGHGDTPIPEILRLLRDNSWKIPALIEYEYGPQGDLDTLVEMKKCYAYCREALMTNAPNRPSPVQADTVV